MTKTLTLTEPEFQLLGSIIGHCILGRDPSIGLVYDKLVNLNNNWRFSLPDIDLTRSSPSKIFLTGPMTGQVVSFNVPHAHAEALNNKIHELIRLNGGVVV